MGDELGRVSHDRDGALRVLVMASPSAYYVALRDAFAPLDNIAIAREGTDRGNVYCDIATYHPDIALLDGDSFDIEGIVARHQALRARSIGLVVLCVHAPKVMRIALEVAAGLCVAVFALPPEALEQPTRHRACYSDLQRMMWAVRDDVMAERTAVAAL